jgi:hypothetical protein
MVEFAKDISIVPPAMDGPLYFEDDAKRQRLEERRKYIKLAKRTKTARGLDNYMSAILLEFNIQHFAHAIWLYEKGRIGIYGHVLDKLEENRNCRH